jgi:hypothetical protein
MLPNDVTQTYRASRSHPTGRRLAGLLVPTGLAVLLFGLLVWPGLAYNFSHKFRLSTAMPNKAFNPDIAAGANGSYVAVVWSEGYNTQPDTKQYGRVYLKSAEATSGWESRLQVFTATASVWGRDPHLVFDPNNPAKVHVVWAQASGCPNCTWSSIRYTTCTLTGVDHCVRPSQVVASGLNNVSTPNVAVDASGGVHFVWREGSVLTAGPIRYCKKGSCGAPTGIGTGQHPSLVYANNFLHLVWDTGSQVTSTIKYQRDNPSDTGWGGLSPKTWWNNPPPSIQYQEPSFPVVGASGSAVYVVWAVKNKVNPIQYALDFDFSQDTGQSWLAGTSGFGHSIPENKTAAFTSTWFAESGSASELYSLKPDVVVTGTGSSAYAHVVWQGGEVGGATYEAWYSYLAGYSDSATWTAPTFVDKHTHDDIGLPVIAMGTALGQTHVAFVEDANAISFRNIDVWYAGANGNRDNDGNVGDGPVFLPIILKNS